MRERHLFLTSSGLTIDMKKQFFDIVGKCPKDIKVLYIPTAGIETDGAREGFALCLDELLAMGICYENILVYNLELILSKDYQRTYSAHVKEPAQIARLLTEQEMNGFDAVFVSGGDSAILCREMVRTGFDEILETAINQGLVYVANMIYYEDKELIIRNMVQSDAGIITDEEVAQGWNQTIDKYEMRLCDQAEGKAVSLVAEYKGHVAGYINVYPHSKWGAFGNQGLPEIVDFGVLKKFRQNGIGNKLMDVAEEVAAKYSDTVYLGVGLNHDYGSAQRMYVKRGYIPDGSGVWYDGKVCPAYAECCNGDDLVLYFSKRIR